MKDLMMFLEWVLMLNPKITAGEAGRMFNIWKLNKKGRA